MSLEKHHHHHRRRECRISYSKQRTNADYRYDAYERKSRQDNKQPITINPYHRCGFLYFTLALLTSGAILGIVHENKGALTVVLTGASIMLRVVLATE